MVSIEEAQAIILQAMVRLPVKELPLLQGLGRVIAEDIRAPFDVPLSDNSAMDGYAFCFGSIGGDRLEVSGFVAAGHAQRAAVAAGSAVRIMTGAPLPPGCDTVVPIEDVEPGDGFIRVKGRLQQGSHVRRRGEDVREGDLVIAEGAVARPQEIAMLASFGMSKLRVYRQATAAILATGDELLPLGQRPRPGQIVNSNSVAVAAQVMEAGATPLEIGIAQDDFQATRRRIAEGLEAADLLITTGGVSVGDKDFVKEAIEDLGGRILFWKVNMKPGKPVAFAMVGGKPLFALPGNPVAAMVGFEEFVRPALLKMMGRERILRPVIKASTAAPLKNKGERPSFVRGMVTEGGDRYTVSAVANQSSANILSLIQSNALVKMPPESSLAAGEAAEVMVLDRDFYDRPCFIPMQSITG